VAATLVLYGGIAVMVTIVTERPAFRILAWAMPVVLVPAVGLSRVYRGDHHPTDAMAGLILGVAALAIGFAAVSAWSRSDAGGHRAPDRRPPSAPVPSRGFEPAHAEVGAGFGTRP
jgi:membrane-associated phospholipid phosphatase